jgi:hypothetical protein
MSASFPNSHPISIVDYLARQGIEPARIRGHNYWYLSPLRQESEPSFKVNARLNLWYDFGLGEGGSLYKLGLRLHGDEQTFRHELVRSNATKSYVYQQPTPNPQPESKVEIVSVDWLTSPDLRKYLVGRGIDFETARHHCKEIEFRIGHNTYLAVGFENYLGGFELRNSWFKGSSSPKGITLLNANQQGICVTEGFMDLLSLEELRKRDSRVRSLTEATGFLVLNSLVFLARNIPLLKRHSPVTLFLDNDPAGRAAKQNLIDHGVPFRDGSALFQSCKDVNEYLVSMIPPVRDVHQALVKKSKGLRK